MKKLKIYSFKNHGFTMIEIVVVLALLVIISVVIISRYTSADSNELMVETDGLKANLRYAQIKAMSDTLQPNSNPRWEFEITNASSYTLYRRDDNAVRVPVNIPGEVPPSPMHNLPAGVTLTSGVGLVITFDDWGSPGSSNISIRLTQGNQSSTINITSNTGYIL